MNTFRAARLVLLSGLLLGLAAVATAALGAAAGGASAAGAAGAPPPAMPVALVEGPAALITPTPAVEHEATVAALAAWGGDRANALALSPDGQTLVVGSALGLFFFDAATLAEVRFIPTDTWVRSVAFSPDGQTIATGSYDNSVRVWRAAEGSVARTLDGHLGWVRSVVFSPDGTLLASASDDHTVNLWNPATGALVRALSEHTEGARVVAFSPDGTLLATGGFDTTIRLWSVADGSLVRTLEGHTGWVRCLAFSPDGQTLASGGFDAMARLWRVADGALLHTLSGHTASVLSVAFSPDGASLATASVDTTLRLWQVADGKLLGRLSGHRAFVFATVFAPDGQTLLSGATDNTVRAWPLSPAGLAAAAKDVERVDDHASPSNCVVCHHPQGDRRQPGVVGQPGRVIDGGCDLCHEGSSLVFNWCPALPRAARPAKVQAMPPDLYDEVGVPHGTRNLNIVMSTPGNGEHWYASNEMRSFVLVNGYLRSAGIDLQQVEVRLEIWAGDELKAELHTWPDGDGSFTFGVDLNPSPLGSQLELPIDMLDCLPCHDPTQAKIVLAKQNLAQVVLTGPVRLEVMAITPEGERAFDERYVIVSRKSEASVPVQVVDETTGAPATVGVRVEAATALYDWRGRTFAGTTAAGGLATVTVEALSAIPTIYTFSVPPTTVNGRLYAGAGSVDVTLAPGATSGEPVTLYVRSTGGTITGQVSGLGQKLAEPVTVRAIRVPDGTRFEALTGADGSFAFADVPVGQYLVAADPAALAAQGLASAARSLDLVQSPQAGALLPLTAMEGNTLQGQVQDEQGQPVPFAWLTLGETWQGQPANVASGAWTLLGAPTGTRTVVAAAPGYYSQAQALPAGSAAALDFNLNLRPDTRRVAWGSGQIVVPAESGVTQAGNRFVLENGWLWGSGEGGEPVTIATAGLEVTLTGGRFALENVPGQMAWLYLLDGQGQMGSVSKNGQLTPISAGSMVALAAPGDLLAVPLDWAVVTALRTGTASPLNPVWELSPEAQFRDRLALMGISTAQFVTFVTYSIVIMALFVVPLLAVVWWSKRTRALSHRPTQP